MNNTILFPKNLVEAKKILSKKEKVVPIAGGTSVLLNFSQNTKLLDLEPLKLDYIKYSNNRLKIGAMTVVNELLDSHLIKKYCNGIIKDAVLTIASTPNRNLITVGGNIVGIHPWSVFPGLLMLLEGKVVTAKKRVIEAEKLFSSVPKNVLEKDIVTEVQFPDVNKHILSYWKKFSITETDYPIVSVGIICENKNDLVKKIRIVAVGLTLFPQRFKEVEEMLNNKKLNKELVDKVLEKIKNVARVSNDIRVSIEYKKEVLTVLVKEFLDKFVCK
ncbi:MAG: FAD binding domain-containing protein [Endomicrobiia bacterium]